MGRIGKLNLEGELLLAPMADYTNVAFRTLAKEYGAALCYTELVSAKALTMKSKRTEYLLKVSEKEKPVFLQLFGANPQDFAKAIELIEKKFPDNFSGYDLNCGCSVPKALRAKYGCSLMNYPLIVGQIVSAIKNEVEKTAPQKPVTIKIRLGLKEETFLEVAREAEKAGASAITLHPRFGSQAYTGNADWTKIHQLKNEVKIPVIGNGDIKKPSDIIEIKKQTKCDFEMIGRAAIGNAFFFRAANALLSDGIEKTKKFEDYFEEGKRFLELAEEFELGVNDVRPYFLGLSKGLIGASALRAAFGMSKTIEEIKNHFNKHFSI